MEKFPRIRGVYREKLIYHMRKRLEYFQLFKIVLASCVKPISITLKQNSWEETGRYCDVKDDVMKSPDKITCLFWSKEAQKWHKRYHAHI